MGKTKTKRHPEPGLELARQVRLMRWRLKQKPNQTFADYEAEFNHWTQIDRLCFELIDL